jgi:heat shock factor-binding protein 1
VHVVDDLLNQLTNKFSTMSSELIEKSKFAYGQVANRSVEEADMGEVDEMSRRLDNLEATIQASNKQTDSDVEK